MAKKTDIPQYGTSVSKGHVYYRTRIKDADGKTLTLRAETPEELYEKERKARDEIEDILFRRANPTVREYCEKWLAMQERKLSYASIRSYRYLTNKYIVDPLGDMYLSDVRSDDIQIAMIPVGERSEGVYAKVNMLFKCIFYSAERSELIDYDVEYEQLKIDREEVKAMDELHKAIDKVLSPLQKELQKQKKQNMER